MGVVLPQTVKVNVSTNGVSYYEQLGYEIPRYYNKRRNKYSVKKGTTIDVSVLDLKDNSNLIIECECDICNRREKLTKMEYTRIHSYTEKYGYEYLCLDCKFDVISTAKLNVGTFKNDEEQIQSLLIRKLKKYIIQHGLPSSKKEAFRPKNDMPSLRMYNEHLPGDLVDWIEMCGYKLSENDKYSIRHRGGKNYNLSKDDCIDIIYKMQDRLKRPLMYKDFQSSSIDTLGVIYIKKYWGSLNKMKKELGLEIVRESMSDKHLTREQFDSVMKQISLDLLNSNKSFITTREINLCNKYPSYGTLSKLCRNYYGVGLAEHARKYNIFLGRQGHGINYIFEDGEHTTSQFEYILSNYLKVHGYKYNKGYFRDVKYSGFIKDYNGNINCDYVIYINNEPIYIEIAGIIGDYKEWYYSNKEISSSKSKEKYRVKLNQKEGILKSNNLKYFILFPCDLTTENFERIISNPSLELKHEIESFHVNNIDWVKVRDIGELDFSKEVIRKDFNRRKIS